MVQLCRLGLTSALNAGEISVLFNVIPVASKQSKMSHSLPTKQSTVHLVKEILPLPISHVKPTQSKLQMLSFISRC